MRPTSPFWLFLLTLDQLDWRDDRRAAGENPDAFIERHLAERGVWPAANGEAGQWLS